MPYKNRRDQIKKHKLFKVQKVIDDLQILFCNFGGKLSNPKRAQYIF